MQRAGESGKERVRRYRERLHAIGRPESWAVDAAVSAAVAAHAARVAGDPAVNPEFLKGVLREAVRRLAASGYDRQQARGKVIRRIGRFSLGSPDNASTK
jgi:hypothetical protein